ncbi:class I SAM-dependent methyltransferase [Nocardiopsis salina]|uniref:class I SAM-dependent methyltransferase n=1 Tax=Nocardiopsis salina TaxID=245836 RepID=UPI0003485593|nr:class I SAM-dependent methyltransferase [Nocardiopsis salina]
MTAKNDHIRGESGSLSAAAQRGLFQLPRRLDFLHDSLPEAPSNILDVGCAGGYIGLVLQRLGHRVTGVELNEAMAAQARQRGIEVVEHDLEEPVPLPDGSFDVVHACEVIEHLFDTEGFLHDLARLLRPGGTLVVSSPNLNSLSNRWRVLRGSALPMWGASPSDRHGGHIRVFNRATLEELLHRTGFTPVKTIGSNQGGRLARMLDRTPNLSELILVRAHREEVIPSR